MSIIAGFLLFVVCGIAGIVLLFCDRKWYERWMHFNEKHTGMRFSAQLINVAVIQFRVIGIVFILLAVFSLYATRFYK